DNGTRGRELELKEGRNNILRSVVVQKRIHGVANARDVHEGDYVIVALRVEVSVAIETWDGGVGLIVAKSRRKGVGDGAKRIFIVGGSDSDHAKHDGEKEGDHWELHFVGRRLVETPKVGKKSRRGDS
ncbi:hypothetical protein ACHAPJ_010224, partial [Fusarium lateritium]